MKKVLGGLVVSMLLLVGATACGGSDDSASGASSTTAAAGSPSSGAPSVEDICAQADKLAAAVKANDTAQLRQLGIEFREMLEKAQKSIANNAQAAAPYGPCIQKASLAMAGKVANP